MVSHNTCQKIHALLTAAAETDPATAADIRSAIDYCLREGEQAPVPDISDDPVSRIAAIHLHGRPDWAHAHVDLSQHGLEPLFIRASVISAMRSIAGTPNAIIIVTGILSSIRPSGTRWTSRRRASYESTVRLIESIIARLSSPRSRVRIIIAG